MSMSLDGYIAGPNDGPGNPGGDGFMRLHEWFGFASAPGPEEDSVHQAGPARQLLDEIRATGAVLSGRNTVEQVDHWGGDHHDGVPIFVASHRPPGPSVARYRLVTYVTDGIASAMAQAKAAAGDRDVLVHGASTAQTALEAGVLDEVQIHQIPVLFGGGRRLFELLPARVEVRSSGPSTRPKPRTSVTAFGPTPLQNEVIFPVPRAADENGVCRDQCQA
jgi:dihydrofolate reductase